MTAAIITIGFLSALTIFSLVALIIENGKRNAANTNLMFTQLAESRRSEAKTQKDVTEIQAALIREQADRINELHTRLTMEEAQASADLNEQYHDFQVPQFAGAGVSASPNGHVPSGWSDPIDSTQAFLEDIPADVPPIPREDEPTDL